MARIKFLEIFCFAAVVGQCADRTLCWQDSVLTGHSADRTLCWQDSVLTGQCADRTLCWQDIVLTGQCADRTVCWQDSVLTGQCADRTVCWQDIQNSSTFGLSKRNALFCMQWEWNFRYYFNKICILCLCATVQTSVTDSFMLTQSCQVVCVTWENSLFVHLMISAMCHVVKQYYSHVVPLNVWMCWLAKMAV